METIYMISNCHRNIMGTISFDAQFPSMRKPQDFIVHPMHDSGELIHIQSDSRFGQLNLGTGELIMSGSKSGANSVTLALDCMKHKALICTLPADELAELRAAIKSTGGLLVGESFVKTDNTGAMAL